MADYNTLYRTRGEYINGNVVTKPVEVPGRDGRTNRERVYRDGKRVQGSRRSIREQERALSINGAYVAFLAVAAVFCLALCIVYLNVQSDISAKQSSITALESEINSIVAENDALDYEINSYIDTDYIYKVAKKELGMVEATADQISLYEKTDSEYMKQLEDIPEE
jgi:cell division protein FtsB